MEAYEGDYRCAVSEDGPCRKEATMVYREPFTPARTPVLACSEHADDLEKAGYHFDEEATVRLARDREKEAEESPRIRLNHLPYAPKER
jgi:hypothetical protein